MNIFFDIETVPAQDPAHLDHIRADMLDKHIAARESIKAPGNYSKPDAITEYIAHAQQAMDAAFDAEVSKAIEKTSFDGGLGQVVCISWALDHGDTYCLSVPSLSAADESALLQNWFSDLKKLHAGNSGTRPCLIGHNSNAFDIPFIWKRAIVHGVRPPLWFPRDPKPWGESTFDTMTAWSGVKDRISMDRLCRVLGIPGKGDGPSGADVWPMVQAGRIDEVAEYCRTDVARTRTIFKRMTFLEAA
jgi:hypothetical protein